LENSEVGVAEGGNKSEGGNREEEEGKAVGGVKVLVDVLVMLEGGPHVLGGSPTIDDDDYLHKLRSVKKSALYVFPYRPAKKPYKKLLIII
jgi:hypothetical protein